MDSPAFLVTRKQAIPSASSEPRRSSTSTRVPEPRSTAPSFFHATPDSLRFATVSGTFVQCLSFITQFPSECICTKLLNVIRHFESSDEWNFLRFSEIEIRHRFG